MQPDATKGKTWKRVKRAKNKTSKNKITNKKSMKKDLGSSETISNKNKIDCDETKLKIIGDSLVHEMGSYVDSSRDHIRACSYPFPDSDAAAVQRRLPSALSTKDECVFILA